MNVTPRETMLALGTVGTILFAGGIMLARPKLEQWKELSAQAQQIRSDIEQDQRLVAQRAQWQSRFSTLSQSLPRLPADKTMDVYWMSKMDDMASKYGVQIIQRRVGEEVNQGDVYELSIECKDWEATLDQLVHFLFELQSEGAMFDVRQLMIKPKGKGALRGRFALFCAYTREASERPAPRTEGAAGADGHRKGAPAPSREENRHEKNAQPNT